MTTTQRNAISSPLTGLLIYNSTTVQYEYYNSSSWVAVGPASTTNALLDGSNHTDTLAGTVARGDVIVGNSTPKWARLAIGSANKVLHSDGTDATWQSLVAADLPANQTTRGIAITMDGGGSTLTTGVRPSFQIPYGCTITRWSIQGDAAGTCTIDVTTATDAATPSYSSIVGAGTKPNVAGPAIGTVSTAPSSWTSTAISARTLMQFNLSAVATFKWLTITLEVTAT